MTPTTRIIILSMAKSIFIQFFESFEKRKQLIFFVSKFNDLKDRLHLMKNK